MHEQHYNINQFDTHQACGKFSLEQKYVDGSQIKDAGFPWLVGILSSRGSPNFPLCYGALISDRHVLTAASCVWK